MLPNSNNHLSFIDFKFRKSVIPEGLKDNMNVSGAP